MTPSGESDSRYRIDYRREEGMQVIECDFSRRTEAPELARVLLVAKGEWSTAWLLTPTEASELGTVLIAAAAVAR